MNLEHFICGPIQDETPGKAAEMFGASWEMYLRAGGAVTPDLWESLPILLRASAAAAGDRVARERAAWAGLAGSSEQGFASVIAPLDAGLRAEQIENDIACDRLFDQAQASSIEPVRRL